MRIEFDLRKRDETLRERGLDFADATKLFEGRHKSAKDERRDYGEERFISIGRLAGRLVVLVWTPRQDGRRIISMRKANAREKKAYEEEMD